MTNRHLLPRLNSSLPPATPVLSLHTAAAVGSPRSPTHGISGSTTSRLTRVIELLTPIKASSSPTTPHSSSKPAMPEQESAKCEEAVIEDVRIDPDVLAGSQIEFFKRHPEDSTNPLTFLDGGSGAGTCNVGTTAFGHPQMQGESSSCNDSPPSGLYTPPQQHTFTAHSSHVTEDSEEWQSEGSTPPIPIPSLPQQRKYTGDGRSRPQILKREGEFILRTRPVTLHELPGRFRSMETCWYCTDGVVGARCAVCGHVVRKTSSELWG